MKKAIITVFAFLVIFGFTISGAMAQTWSAPQKITNGPFVDFMSFPDYEVLNGYVSTPTPSWAEVITDTVVEGVPVVPAPSFSDLVAEDSVVAPPAGIKYGVFGTTVGMWVAGQGQSGEYVALNNQPNVPAEGGTALAGSFKYIAAGSDGTLYVIFEKTQAEPAEPIEQFLLVGYSNWEIVTVRFTPRSLNLGSNGNWVTCKISDFPDGYTPADVDMERVCIVAINGKFLAETDELICSKDSGGPYNNRNKKKLMVKFDRKSLADFITANPNTEEPNTANITVAGYSTDGSLQFYGDDTIKIKPAKEKKNKKK